MNSTNFKIGERVIGPDQPVYMIAELSANHNQDFDEAVRLIHAAKETGVDAVKLQTYTPDTLTINCDQKYFQIGKGTIWEGRTLYDLYGEAYTPWDWQPRLKEIANEIGLDLFSTPFDATAIEFLEQMDVPAYKVASFEIVDLHLIEKIAATGKPIIMSTGMATSDEIDEAVCAARGAGAKEIALLKCTSAYPAAANEMHLRTIPHLAEAYGVPAGLSDHTLGTSVAVASVALGACIIEKHFCLSRDDGGPDAAFSLEPAEMLQLVQEVRTTEQALGNVQLGASEREMASRIFRRSLFVVSDMQAGDIFTDQNVRSIRPGDGLAPKHLTDVLGRRAMCDISKGTPLSFDLLAGTEAKKSA